MRHRERKREREREREREEERKREEGVRKERKEREEKKRKSEKRGELAVDSRATAQGHISGKTAPKIKADFFFLVFFV